MKKICANCDAFVLKNKDEGECRANAPLGVATGGISLVYKAYWPVIQSTEIGCRRFQEVHDGRFSQQDNFEMGESWYGHRPSKDLDK